MYVSDLVLDVLDADFIVFLTWLVIVCLSFYVGPTSVFYLCYEINICINYFNTNS